MAFQVELLPNENLSRLEPPLKWAGGKRWLAPTIKKIYDHFLGTRFVEPFVGGMAVALYVMPQNALLNDINPHLINFYRWLQRGLTIDIPLLNDEKVYYEYRDWFNNLISNGMGSSKEAAMLFYYLNRTGFNGLCRFNSEGKLNVPYGKYKHINYRKDFSEYREVIKNWQFSNGDFSEITLEPKDFVYVDPPYDVEFTKYSQTDFSWKDQERLVEWLSDHPGPILASNQATPRIVKLYEAFGFQIKFLEAPRMISSNGNREKAIEILAWKNIPSEYMTPGDTSSGIHFEHSLQKALEVGGYTYFLRGSGKSSVRTFPEPIPSSKSRGVFILDGLAIHPKTQHRIGISAKWQQVSGTAEEKVPLEFIRLMLLIEGKHIDRAYIVLGGNGWTLKSFFTSPEFRELFSSPYKNLVFVVEEDVFIEKAQSGLL